MAVWNGKLIRPGNTSKAESNNMVVGLGEGLSVTLCGGESAVDPSIRKCHAESVTMGPDDGTVKITDCWADDGRTTLGSITSMSLWIKLHLNTQSRTFLVIELNYSETTCTRNPLIQARSLIEDGGV